ncbi:hypothetical protein F2Q69_00053076 [Brassica cretica]|uniref:Uncharacterized protein n=1 Tax=Brassica cretica TaxID=69181 RepID=A0A8S9MWH2_BRACR|nr:hypothetical protein F2Q69_00053076 [Brassica cretica]
MHGLMSYRRFGRARSLRSDRSLVRARSLRSDRAEWMFGRYVATELWLELGRYVATEQSTCLVAAFVVSGLLALLRVEHDKTGAAPYDGCLRTLVEGIKPFGVRLGVKKEDYELSSRNLTLYAQILAKRQILGSRIKVFDTMPRDVRDQCAGFRARPRFTPGFRGCDD